MGRGIKLIIAESPSPRCEIAHDVLSLGYCPDDILDVIQGVEDIHGIDVVRGGVTTLIGKGMRYGQTEKTPLGKQVLLNIKYRKQHGMKKL